MSSPYGRKMCKSKRLFICVGVYPVLLGRQVAVFAFLHCLLLTSHIENIKRIQYLTPKTQIDRQLGTIRYIKVNRERQREREAGSDQSALRLTFPPPPPPPPLVVLRHFVGTVFGPDPLGETDGSLANALLYQTQTNLPLPSMGESSFVPSERECVCIWREGGISFRWVYTPGPGPAVLLFIHSISFLFFFLLHFLYDRESRKGTLRARPSSLSLALRQIRQEPVFQSKHPVLSHTHSLSYPIVSYLPALASYNEGRTSRVTAVSLSS